MFTLRPSCGRAVTFYPMKQPNEEKKQRKLNNRAKPVCFHTTSISASLFPMSAFVSSFSAHTLALRTLRAITASCGAQPNNMSQIQFRIFFLRDSTLCVRALCSRHAIFRFLFILNFSINFFSSIGRRSRLRWLVTSDDIIIKVVSSQQVTYLSFASLSVPVGTPHANEIGRVEQKIEKKTFLDQKLITRNSNSSKFAFN